MMSTFLSLLTATTRVKVDQELPLYYNTYPEVKKFFDAVVRCLVEELPLLSSLRDRLYIALEAPTIALVEYENKHIVVSLLLERNRAIASLRIKPILVRQIVSTIGKKLNLEDRELEQAKRRATQKVSVRETCTVVKTRLTLSTYDGTLLRRCSEKIARAVVAVMSGKTGSYDEKLVKEISKEVYRFFKEKKFLCRDDEYCRAVVTQLFTRLVSTLR